MNVLIADGNNGYSQTLVGKLENNDFELSERCRLVELAVEVGVALTRREELGKILQACSDSVIRHLDAALVGIWMLNDLKVSLELRASAASGKISRRAQIGQAIAWRVAQERMPCWSNAVVRQLNGREQDWARREGVTAFAGYPLIAEDQLVGVLGIFTQEELPEATLGTLAGIADCIAGGIQGKMEDAVLRESEARFRQLAANINEVWWMTDAARREILYVSPAYESIWGRTEASLRERPSSLFDAVHPDDRPRVFGTLQGEPSVPYELEYRIVRPDSTELWIRERAFPVRDPAGSVIRVARVAEDVTRKRESEMQLSQAQKMQAVGRLAGGVAHDFNNLLSVIFGHSALLAASAPSEERLRNSVAEINRAAERAAALTQQLLAFGRRQVVEPRALDIGLLLAQSQNHLRRLIGEQVRLTLNLAPGLSLVNADLGQINQILMNLVQNARDSMSHGGELTLEASEVGFDAASESPGADTRPRRYVLLAVTDTGTGMTPEVQARAFEPFFTTKRGHTGLGLSVVEGIVTQSGGHLTVTTRPGLGSTFNIFLPALEEQLDRPLTSALCKPAAANETILLVEDEDPVREVTALLLESLGYSVLQVAGAEEALELVRDKRPEIDLLFTDVLMPGMSGRELAEVFRVHHPHIKVLFQSGHTDDVVVRLGILNAEVAFLQKPFTVGTLAKKIRELLDHK
jgi:two-component system, cell cycle sensor histidine kinase and response regulator CckA